MQTLLRKLTVFALCFSAVAAFAQPEKKQPAGASSECHKELGEGEMDGPFGRGGHPGRMVQQILEELEQKEPQKYAQLMELRESNREEYFAAIRKLMMPHFRNSKKMDELEAKCFELAHLYHQARTDEERKVLKEEIQAAVANATDARIKDMKERLETMNRQQAEMEKNRDEIVARRVKTLLKKPKIHKKPMTAPKDADK